MDEVGFIISKIESDGYLRFKKVGGIDTGVILGKRVFVGKNKIPGVIGMRAVHLQKNPDDEVSNDNLYIDIGAKSREEAGKLVGIGSYAAFDPQYIEFGDRCVMAKALDNRAGCAIALEILNRHKDKNLCFAFTVQEEVGCRGAKAAVQRFKPDAAIVLETTICNDTYPNEPHHTPTFLGKGAVLPFMDSSAVHDRGLISSLIAVADENNIHWQYKRTNMGGTDAGSIMRAGIPTAVVAIPCRNIHSPSTVISLNDYDSALELADKWIESR